MKVQEFVDKYNSFSNEPLKEKLCNEVIKNEYVPFTTKMNICRNIANITTHQKVTVNDKQFEYLNVDTANRYLLFRIKLLMDYTSLEFSEDIREQIKEYELLDKYGINEILTSMIDEREYAAYKMILNMYVNDYVMNETNIVNYLDNKINALSLSFDTIMDVANDLINDPEKIKVLKDIVSNKETE